MSDFDYGNARLRAMRARLLPFSLLIALAGSGPGPAGVAALLNALTRSVYRPAVEAALLHYRGVEAVNRAVEQEFAQTVGRVHTFFGDAKPAEVAGWVFTRYDVDNLKAVLRGLRQQATAEEIMAAVVPAGHLSLADWNELARASDGGQLIDLLATWRVSLARPLLALRGERPGADLFTTELALEQWYFQSAGPAKDEEHSSLTEWLNGAADVTNLLTALRLAGAAESAVLLEQRFGAADPRPLFVGPGRLPFALLIEAAGQKSVAQAVETVADTAYGPALAAAAKRYPLSRRLSEFEHALRQQQLQQAAGLLARDPLGIGVLIGYLALKANEAANLRQIAWGLQLGLDAETIRAELLLAS
jgi:vacuolar-type H+-ATPase subunit C/Vma6